MQNALNTEVIQIESNKQSVSLTCRRQHSVGAEVTGQSVQSRGTAYRSGVVGVLLPLCTPSLHQETTEKTEPLPRLRLTNVLC